MAGAKSETEIITISTNFSFVTYDTNESNIMFNFLIWTSALNILHF